jgi:hypothetical protein
LKPRRSPHDAIALPPHSRTSVSARALETPGWDEQRKRRWRPLLPRETRSLRREARPELTAPPDRLQAAGRFGRNPS